MALDSSGQLHAPAALLPRDNLSSHLIRGFVSLIFGMDDFGRRDEERSELQTVWIMDFEEEALSCFKVGASVWLEMARNRAMITGSGAETQVPPLPPCETLPLHQTIAYLI